MKKQRSHLIAIIDTLGLPTILFAHSEADLQWSELAGLICPQDPESSSSHSKAVTDNSAVAVWFFHHHIQKVHGCFFTSVSLVLLDAISVAALL